MMKLAILSTLLCLTTACATMNTEQRQLVDRAAGKPPGNLYHVISNETISFQSSTEATYQSYWQTMRRNEDGRYIAGGFGRSEDHLVRQADGRWLIKFRKLVVFTD